MRAIIRSTVRARCAAWRTPTYQYCGTLQQGPTRVLEPSCLSNTAYVRLLHTGGKHEFFWLSEVVGRAFLADYPTDKTPIVLHRDGDRMNCCVDNRVLKRDDSGQVMTIQRRFAPEEVAEIRRLWAEGVSGLELAARFGRTPSGISRIVCENPYTRKRKPAKSDPTPQD